MSTVSQTPPRRALPHLDWAWHGAHLSDPGAQEADAHLPVVIQVGVQAATALGEVAEVGRHGRVDVGELDVKQVEAVLVGGASGALDQGREEVLGGGEGCGWRGLPRGWGAGGGLPRTPGAARGREATCRSLGTDLPGIL